MCPRPRQMHAHTSHFLGPNTQRITHRFRKKNYEQSSSVGIERLTHSGHSEYNHVNFRYGEREANIVSETDE